MWLRGSRHRRSMWYFHLRGKVNIYGPVGPMTRKEMVDYLRSFWGNGRVPYGTQFWKVREVQGGSK
jgi:hypothetical protein